HAGKEDCERQIKEAVEIYREFFKSLCIPFKLVIRPDHDKFAGADYTIAFDMMMPDGKALQGGTVHNLGENFAKVYNLTYDDEKGEKKFMHQTSYGISMRALALLIAIHGDDKGLILPPLVAPIQVIIVPIFFGDREPVIAECRKVLQELKDKGVRVKIDARDIRPGEKYYHWEGKGVPFRIEIGPKDIEKKQVVLANRLGEKAVVPVEEASDRVLISFVHFTEKLRGRAEADLKSRTKIVKDLEEAKASMEKPGFLELGWCGSEECARKIAEETGAELRGSLWGGKEHKETCVACGKEGKLAIAAKAY
ncbi:MAG: His/Gly/Thr/Pro-type tRNA ligase C-terminal domain-containing protein, partial [Candidatus Micrarchaeota archaeon]